MIAGVPQLLLAGVCVGFAEGLLEGVDEGFAEGPLDVVAVGLSVGLGVSVVALGLPPQASEPSRTTTPRDASRLRIGGDYEAWASISCRSALATLGFA